jgi:hypothetical protein
MNLNQFEPRGLMDFLFPASPLKLGKSSLTLGLNFKMQGLQDLQAEIRGSAPVMTLLRNGKSATITSSGFSASAGMGEEGIRVTLKGLTLEEHRMGVSGEFVADGGERGIHVQLEGREVDISSARQTALALLGDEPGVAKVFTILKGGKAPVVTFQTRGTTWADLFDLNQVVINGPLEAFFLRQGNDFVTYLSDNVNVLFDFLNASFFKPFFLVTPAKSALAPGTVPRKSHKEAVCFVRWSYWPYLVPHGYYDCYSAFSGWIGKTGVDILDITFFLFLPWVVLFLFLMEPVFFEFDAIPASFF